MLLLVSDDFIIFCSFRYFDPVLCKSDLRLRGGHWGFGNSTEESVLNRGHTYINV